MGTIGKQLTNPFEMFGKPSVYVGNWRRPCAVAFLISMQLKEIKRLFDIGVYEYTPINKSKFKPFNGQLLPCQN